MDHRTSRERHVTMAAHDCLPDVDVRKLESIDMLLANLVASKNYDLSGMTGLHFDFQANGNTTVRILRAGQPSASMVWEKPKTVEEKIEAWHEGSAGRGQEIWEYLGWTREQYVVYVEKGELIPAEEANNADV